MRSRHLCGLALVAVALTCCTRSPADQLKMELQTVSSWTTTARAVGEAWQKGAVPRPYATKTLSNAVEALQKESQTIEGLKPEAGVGLRDQLLNQTRRVVEVIDRMRGAIEKGDDQALAQLLGQLGVEEQAVKAEARSAGVAQP